MDNNKPWIDRKDIWKDEKAFNQALRNISRRAWNKLPIKFITKKEATYKKQVGVLKNGKPKYINYCTCEICKIPTKASLCDVDHIYPAGPFTDREGFKEWFARLVYISSKDLSVICKKCHAKKTYAERAGISFSESARLAPLREFLSRNASSQKLFLSSKGFSAEAIKNKGNREKSFKKCCI